ncbi:SDR family NAD(P)-dependent oxidoreductase [Streptomyces sp. NPDC049954]|uniref:SDR family NAD(P)-dependent oxidoreductase n=1 Tax=Streptomyces sp. NPDC049954 TaxID=3155779 RepID=UPI00342F7EC9
MPFRFPGDTTHTRVALVTVADTGLGRAVARQLARAGMRVYAGARGEEAGRAVAGEPGACGLDVRHVPLDLHDDATVSRAAELIEQSAGHLDVLVTMTGLTAFPGRTGADSPDGFQAVFETNFLDGLHLMTVTNAMFPLLRRSAGGRVVNVFSAFQPPATTRDVVPRNAVEALTLHYADLGRPDGVLVNAVCVAAEIPARDGREDGAASLRAAALPVRLALTGDHARTATYTGPDGVCASLSAGPGGATGVVTIDVV